MTVTHLEQDVRGLEEILPYEETDDPNAKAHIINPPNNMHIWRPGMTAKDVVDIARATGQYVISLCQVAFIPKHNPEPLDACEACMRIAGDIIKEDG